MSKHNDQVYLHHIIDSIDKVQGYLGETTYDDFLSNSLLIDAIVRNIEIIGEASNNISEECKEGHININFRPATSMRNQLIHGYDDVDLEVVWHTVTEDLPALKKQLVELI